MFPTRQREGLLDPELELPRGEPAEQFPGTLKALYAAVSGLNSCSDKWGLSESFQHGVETVEGYSVGRRDFHSDWPPLRSVVNHEESVRGRPSSGTLFPWLTREVQVRRKRAALSVSNLQRSLSHR